jgi:hypothetical protein
MLGSKPFRGLGRVAELGPQQTPRGQLPAHSKRALSLRLAAKTYASRGMLKFPFVR